MCLHLNVSMCANLADFGVFGRYRGNLSMVKADDQDLIRMKSEGNHLSHALRGKNHDLVECLKNHERVLISNYNHWRDRTSRK